MTTTPTFALRLEADTGEVRTVPVSFDTHNLTDTQRVDTLARWDGQNPAQLAASLLFTRTGLPETDWPAVGPVLQAAVEGDITVFDFEVPDAR